MLSFRKIAGIVLAALVLLLTIISVLTIWDIVDIDVKKVLSKSMYSLFIIFIGTLLLMFIFSVLVKDDNMTQPPSLNP